MKIGRRKVLGLVALLSLTGCGWQDFGTDYCKTEGRRISDREKIVRFMTESGSANSDWLKYIRNGFLHFDQWMTREAPNPADTIRVGDAINRYLDKYPNFVQLVGREPFVWNLDRDIYLQRALDEGYYADFVIMNLRDGEYPKFHEGSKRNDWNSRLRYSVTNCGKYINWQLVGG